MRALLPSVRPAAVTVLAAVPVKPFGVAKARLGPRLDPAARARLGKAVAARTIACAQEAGAKAVVVTAHPDVERWAHGLGADVIPEAPGYPTGLDGAAAAAAAAAARTGSAWAIVHADLPLLAPADLAAVFDGLDGAATVLAPSYDGGSNVVAGWAPAFAFAYGPASFHRHLRVAPRPVRVVVRTGLALDLDGPADLDAALALPGGRWLAGVIG